MASDDSVRVRTTRQRAAEVSRERFLEVGLELVAERLQSPLRNVRAKDVVERTGYTTGAFYHHWQSQSAFQDDLRQFLSGQDQREANRSAIASKFMTTTGDPLATAQQTFETEIEKLTHDVAWFVELAMLASPSDADHETCRREYEQWVGELIGFYGDLLANLGVSLRQGFTLEQFTRTLMALLEGFALQVRATNGPAADELQAAIKSAFSALITSMIERPTSPLTGQEVSKQ